MGSCPGSGNGLVTSPPAQLCSLVCVSGDPAQVHAPLSPKPGLWVLDTGCVPRGSEGHVQQQQGLEKEEGPAVRRLVEGRPQEGSRPGGETALSLRGPHRKREPHSALGQSQKAGPSLGHPHLKPLSLRQFPMLQSGRSEGSDRTVRAPPQAGSGGGVVLCLSPRRGTASSAICTPSSA